MKKELQQKYERLTQIIGECPSALIAYSGGVDSTLLLKVCVDVLGEKCLAVFSDSVLQPARERKATLDLARKLGAELLVLEGIDLEHDAFSKHPTDRCYFCKGLIFDKVIEVATQRGISSIFDGSNQDDLLDYRPGKKALKERSIRSPLQEANFSKQEIRELSKELDLPTWDKDALACLATRIPYFEKVSKEKLTLIDTIEETLVKNGFRNVRARLFKEEVSIEVRSSQIDLLKKTISSLNFSELIEGSPWKRIVIDMKGYQQGNMNQK